MAAGAYNKLNAADQAVSGAWAQVENVYQRRADLIPNLVETVKGAANFEKETLTQVIQARASASQIKLDANAIKDPANFQKFQQAQDQLGGALSRLLVTVEKYPELKANQNFRDLQTQLEGTENRISVERGRFNDTTQAYNTLRRSFPTVIVANFAGFKERPFFKAAEGSDKPPAVKF
jgi:LemA protein